MNSFHYDKLKPFIDKLSHIYSVEVLYGQKYNAIKTNYKSIKLCLKDNYNPWDFEHEFAHLKFLTENIEIKYLYPISEFRNDEVLIRLSNELCNIVYDMYVDAYLYFNDLAPSNYFENKIKIFTFYNKNIEKSLDLPAHQVSMIKESLDEYIKSLCKIVEDSIDEINYLKINDIKNQENHIISYLSKINEENKFEWITKKMLHYSNKMV